MLKLKKNNSGAKKLIIIQQTLRTSPHMQPPLHRTNLHQYAPTPVPTRCHCYFRHNYSNFSLTNGFTCTGSKQTAMTVTALSVRVLKTWLFQSLQSGDFESRGGTKVFGKSAYPVLSRSIFTHNGAHRHHTSSHYKTRVSAQIKHLFAQIWFSKIWCSNTGSAQHSSRLDVSFTNGYRRFDRQ